MRIITQIAPSVSARAIAMLPYLEGLTEDGLLAKFVRETRYYIRYPEKHGVVCRYGTECLDDFYKVYSETGERQGFSIRPKEYLAGFLAAFPAAARLYMYVALGIHPQSLLPEMNATTTTKFHGDWRAEMAAIRPYYDDPKVVAVGECGLDHFYPIPRDEQIALFRAELELARELDLPILMHALFFFSGLSFISHCDTS